MSLPHLARTACTMSRPCASRATFARHWFRRRSDAWYPAADASDPPVVDLNEHDRRCADCGQAVAHRHRPNSASSSFSLVTKVPLPLAGVAAVQGPPLRPWKSSRIVTSHRIETGSTYDQDDQQWQRPSRQHSLPITDEALGAAQRNRGPKIHAIPNETAVRYRRETGRCRMRGR